MILKNKQKKERKINMIKTETVNGITYSYNEYYRSKVVVDIDIKDGVKKAEFIDFGNGIQYNLKELFKQFPDIETLVIDINVYNIQMSNFMFPNLKRIIVNEKSPYYTADGTLLFKRQGNNGLQLVNVFNKKTGDEINLQKATSIQDYALEGCMSANILNLKNGVFAANYYCIRNLKGSIFSINPYKYMEDGLITVGNHLIDYDKDADSITLKGIQDVRCVITTKHIIFKDMESYDTLSKGPGFDADIVTFDCEGIIDLEYLRRFSLKTINVTGENKRYSSYDGILYSKDKKQLLYCPISKSGDITILQGTELISEFAFSSSHLNSIEMPDSVTFIGAYAFQYSSIESIKIGENVKYIGNRAFMSAHIEELDIPSSLKTLSEALLNDAYCQSVILHDGLEAISKHALKAHNIASIHIPGTVKYVEENSLDLDITDVYVERDYPIGIVHAMLNEYETDSKVKCLHIKDYGDIFLPSKVTKSNICYLNSYFNINMLDTNFTSSIYKYGTTPDVKQDTAIKVYAATKDEEVKKYLRRSGKSIASRLIESGCESDVIQFLRFELLTANALKSIKKLADDNGMTQVSAYILQCTQNEKDKHGFSL